MRKLSREQLQALLDNFDNIRVSGHTVADWRLPDHLGYEGLSDPDILDDCTVLELYDQPFFGSLEPVISMSIKELLDAEYTDPGVLRVAATGEKEERYVIRFLKETPLSIDEEL